MEVHLIFAILLVIHSAILVQSVTDEPDHHHYHHQHHEHDDGDQHNHDDDVHSAEFIEVSIKSYGENCLEENTKCNTDEHLICSEETGKCDCNWQVGFHYSDVAGGCLEVPSAAKMPLDEFMEMGEEPQTTTPTSSTTTTTETPTEKLLNSILDEKSSVVNNQIDEDEPVNLCSQVDCAESLGRFARCDESTGVCLCHDVESKNRTVTQINGKCTVVRGINDECSSHDECRATIKGNAWCHMDLAKRTRFCQCEIFNYFDENLLECLPFASDGLLSPCKTDFQCTGFEVEITGHGLGPNAVCNPDSGLCECKLGSKGKGFLYENYCFYELQFGDPCNIDRECQISLKGQDVVCDPVSKTCVCKNGDGENCPLENKDLGLRNVVSAQTDDESSDDETIFKQIKTAMGLNVPNFVFIMIIAAVVILVVVLMSVFIVRKRHKYTVVRSNDTPDKDRSHP